MSHPCLLCSGYVPAREPTGGEAWAASLAGLERVVADDVRFENEAAAVRALGGTVIDVRRLGLVRLPGGHASEAGVVADELVTNNGDVSDLQRGIAYLFEARPDARSVAA